MRNCLQLKPVKITRCVRRAPITTPTQQRHLRIFQRAHLKGIATIVHNDSNDELEGTCLRSATANGELGDSARAAGGVKDPRLPLSPLMDPDLLAGRNRYKVPKSQPGSDLSAFQKKLLKDPYAQALATPVRQCAVTGSRLPNFFLLNFGLIPHTRTGKPWQMPKLVVDANTIKKSIVSTVGNGEEDGTTPNYPDIEPTEPTKGPVRTSAGSHIVAQQSAIKLISTLKHRSYMQLLPQRWKLDARFKADQIVWRKDMDTFVLNLLRRKAAKLLEYLSLQAAAYIVPCQDYDDIRRKHQPAAVLWLGRQHRNDDNAVPIEDDPPPFAMDPTIYQSYKT
ncbi:MAG: hypothetical protein Q9169_001684 [Polycauliona sp. 2 TL-2023]